MEQKARPDELQPLTKTQMAKIKEYIDRLNSVKTTRGNLPVGMELTWEMCVSPELAIIYADPIEDYNSWYEGWPIAPGESPFGPAIAPPMLLAFLSNKFWMLAAGGQGGTRGGIATTWDTQIVAPCPLGTKVIYRGKLAEKYIKRDREYVRLEVTVEDAKTGQLYMKSSYDSLTRYAKVQ